MLRTSFRMPNIFFPLTDSAKREAVRDFSIPNLRYLGNFSFSGPTLQGRPKADFDIFKDFGVSRIVDFRADAPDKFGETCRENGFSYFKFPLDTIEKLSDSDYYCRQSKDNNSFEVSAALITMLKKFMDIMKNGHVYAGCQYGIDRTNKGLTINYFLNREQAAPRLLHWEDETQKTVVNRNVRIVNKIFRHMTPEQKRELGLPESFKDILSKKMPDFIKENRS